MQYVTVVIPLFNKEKYIIRTLDSVTHQDYPYFEVIVVDDGSTDNGAKLAKAYPDDRIRVLSISRSGTSEARNVGISEAKHELIAFLDADDIWAPFFLSAAMRLHRRYPRAGIYAAAYETNTKGVRRRPRFFGLPKYEWEGIIPCYFKAVLRDIPVISSAAMVRKEVFSDVGMFKPGAQLGEDQDMWCRIALEYPVAYSMKVCAVYYKNTQSSVCFDRTLLQEYPVIRTVQEAIEKTEIPDEKKYLELYLRKLYLDYAVRLIRAGCLKEACGKIGDAGLSALLRRPAVVFYLLSAIIKKIFNYQA